MYGTGTMQELKIRTLPKHIGKVRIWCYIKPMITQTY